MGESPGLLQYCPFFPLFCSFSWILWLGKCSLNPLGFWLDLGTLRTKDDGKIGMMYLCWFGVGFWHYGNTGSEIRAHRHPSGTTAEHQQSYRLYGTTAGLQRYYRLRHGTTVLPSLTAYQLQYLVHMFPSFCISCVFLFPRSWFWSGDGSRRNSKRKATGQESKSVKKTSSKRKEPVKLLSEIPLPDYKAYRGVNPYSRDQDPKLEGTQFWNKAQGYVYLWC